ncbi:hypothetical protein [Muricomes intestini]
MAKKKAVIKPEYQSSRHRRRHPEERSLSLQKTKTSRNMKYFVEDKYEG